MQNQDHSKILKVMVVLYLSGQNEKSTNRTDKRNMFGARVKIMWDEQLVDPPVHYITSVNAPP